MSRRIGPLAVVVLLLVALCLPGTGVAGTSALRLTVRGSPFSPDGDGSRDRVTAIVTLATDATLDLRVEDFDGVVVRRLAVARSLAGGTHRFTWNGRTWSGRTLPSAPYRLVAEAIGTKGSQSAEAWVTSAPARIFPVRPRAIVVAIDPGHGGTRSGAVAPDGTREADLNLDIALRLERMLLAAGVTVVITRRTDTDVNEPPIDRNEDTLVDYDDELLSRPDAANLARADVFLSVHNNTAVNPGVGGPATLYSATRPFSPRSRRFARIVQREVMTALGRFADATWRPYDHGALTHEYVVLRAYEPPRIPRPSLMPGALSEGVFLSHPRELALIHRPAVRGAIAAAYYAAIADWIATRGTAVRTHLVSGPGAPVAPGAPLTYGVVVRNTGSATVSGLALRAGLLPGVSPYDGSGSAGDELARVPVPDLAPGASTRIELDFVAPATDGAWLLAFDAVLPSGRRLSDLGVVALQVPLITAPAPARRRR